VKTEDKSASKEKPNDLVVPEMTLPDKVTLKDLLNLLSFGPGICGFLIFAFVCITGALLQLATSFTLANWTTQDLEEQQRTFMYPGYFIGAIVLYVIFTMLRAIIAFWIVLSSATNLHNKAV